MVRKSANIYLIGIFLLSLSLVTSQRASGEVMFEGYSIIRSGDATVGFTVSKYEFDAVKKQFTSTYFLKTNEVGGNITESLKAVSNDKFLPVSYQYTSKSGDTLKIIDAKFSKLSMTGTVSDGKKTQSLNKKIPKGTFLSTFLGYLMLQNGYKVNKKFTYSAIAEEDGQAFSGEAYIKAEEDVAGQKAFRILNKFKGSEFISFLTAKGEVLSTKSPMQSISTEMVATAAEATKGFIVPTETLKLLFGSVPIGKINILAKKIESATGSGEKATKALVVEPAPAKDAAPKSGD